MPCSVADDFCAAVPEDAAAPAASEPQASETPESSAPAPTAEAPAVKTEAAAPSPEAELETAAAPGEEAVSNKRGLRSLFKMPSLLMPNAEQENEAAAGDAEPEVSAEPSPAPSPTASPTASPTETAPVRSRLEIRKDASFEQLLELLKLKTAKLPEEETVSRIYEIRYFPEKADAAEEELVISVIGEEVYCVRKAADGTEKSYRAECTVSELKAQIWQFDDTQTEEVVDDSLLSTLLGGLKPKASPAPSPAPEATPKPSDSPAARTSQSESEA